MNDLTICVPCALYHNDIVHRAIESIEAQTIQCDYIVQQDTLSRGAGFSRNRALERVTTPLCAFLDADDTLDPHFAETCLGILSQYAQSHEDTRYVYTDWIGLNNVIQQAPSPCQAWTEKTSHLVTAVIPTERARLIGGFDEQMSGVEDADFYVRLRLSGICGIHVESPLVHYREGGQRSIQARATGQEALAQQYMTNRYGGYSMSGCCGDNTPAPIGPTNEPLEGDVLAQALYHGNARKRGRITGRLYPRLSHPQMLYMSPEDIKADPILWQAVTTPMSASNGVILQPQYKSGAVPWQMTVDAIYGGGQPQPMSAPVQYQPPMVTRKKSDVVAKAQDWPREVKATKETWTRVEGDSE